MAEGKLEFDTLNLSYITAENEKISIFSQLYTMYDGRSIISGVTQTGKSLSLRGIAKGETFIDDVIDIVGERHNLTINSIGYGTCQVLDFDLTYDRYDGSNNWYHYRLDFAKENLS